MAKANGTNGAKNGRGKQARNSPTAHLDEYKWKPGQSGNPSGRPRGSVSLVRILREMLQEEDGERAKAIIRKAMDEAEEGSYQHLREIIDRIDGPVKQTVQVEHSVKAIDRTVWDAV